MSELDEMMGMGMEQNQRTKHGGEETQEETKEVMITSL